LPSRSWRYATGALTVFGLIGDPSALGTARSKGLNKKEAFASWEKGKQGQRRAQKLS
jgi:hypothetical protein